MPGQRLANPFAVIPAHAGIQCPPSPISHWSPAFAGMTALSSWPLANR